MMADDPQTSMGRLDLGAICEATTVEATTMDVEEEASDLNKSTADPEKDGTSSRLLPPATTSSDTGYNTDTTADVDETLPMLEDGTKNNEANDDALSVSSSSSDIDADNAATSPDRASDLLVAATSLKDEGNAYFKAGDYDQAARSYRRGCSSLKKLPNFAGDEQVQCCWIALQTNLSMVLWKQGKHRQSAKVATKVLEREPNHVKALYRRALAFRQLGSLEEARDDLRAAVRAEPNNTACKKELVAVKKELELSRESQKKALSRAFSSKSSLLYDDKEAAERRKEEQKRLEKQAQQELYKKRKQEWEDECVKRMARNEPAVSFEDWETEQKEEEKRKRKEEEKARKAMEKQRKEELRRLRRESAQLDEDSDSDGEVLTEKELAMMRGYKKTKDGRTTSYFTRELSEEEKQVYDIAPKRLNEVSNTPPTRLASSGSLQASEGKGHSAWNIAGTWEEKDASAWCTEQLRKRLEDVAFNSLGDSDLDVIVANVEKLEGHASVAVTGGKKRYIFEYEASLKYELKSENDYIVASGVAQLPDISSTHIMDDLEIAFDSWTKRPGVDLEGKALKARSSFVDQVRLQVQQWVRDFNDQY